MSNDIGGAVVGLVIGLAVVGVGGYLIESHAQEVDAAEPVDARILETDVEREADQTGGDEAEYSPHVVYAFLYEGERHTSDVVYPGVGTRTMSRGEARTVVDRYSRGDWVTAYVVSGNPDNTFLIKQPVPDGMYLIPAIGGLFVVASLASIVQNRFGLDLPGVK